MSLEKLRILHTNDLHSQLEQWPAVTALLKQQREEALLNGEEVLLLDIGDHCDRVNPITEALLGKGNVKLLNEMNYDAVTIGNNEGITFSKQSLESLYSDANFQVIISNLKNSDGTRPSWVVPYKIYTLKSGVKVGLTGVTVPFRMFYEPLGWLISDPLLEMKETIAEIQSKVDFLICLSHIGMNEDEKMAKEFPSLDLILGAHTHHLLLNGKKINDTWINQSGRSGEYIGEIHVSFQKTTTTSFDVKIDQIQSLKVNKEIRDSQTEKSLKELTAEGNSFLDKQVAYLESDLEVDWYNPSAFTSFLSKTLREWCDADVSMVNAGVLLHNLKRGAVTFADLHETCPHPINPASLMIRGERLLEIIRQSKQEEMVHLQLKGFGFRGKLLGYMDFDGIEIVGDDSLLTENNVKVCGKMLERELEYKLATLDMFTLGHLYPAISSIKNKTYYMPEFLRDLLAWKLNKEV